MKSETFGHVLGEQSVVQARIYVELEDGLKSTIKWTCVIMQ